MAGTFDEASAQKSGFSLPRPQMSNADLARLINSDEVLSPCTPLSPSLLSAAAAPAHLPIPPCCTERLLTPCTLPSLSVLSAAEPVRRPVPPLC